MTATALYSRRIDNMILRSFLCNKTLLGIFYNRGPADDASKILFAVMLVRLLPKNVLNLYIEGWIE